jgi:hypothetical protein
MSSRAGGSVRRAHIPWRRRTTSFAIAPSTHLPTLPFGHELVDHTYKTAAGQFSDPRLTLSQPELTAWPSGARAGPARKLMVGPEEGRSRDP